DSGSAKRLAGVAAALLIRINHRERLRHAFRMWQVVVGDDQVDPSALRGFGSGKGADAGIHADNDPNAALGGLLDDLIAHAIAFADAMRDVVVHRSAAELQGRFENDDGGGAVHVVVAVDEDGLAALDGSAQA